MHFSNFNDRNLNSLDARNVEIIVHNVVKKDINRKNYMRKDKNSHQSVKWQRIFIFVTKYVNLRIKFPQKLIKHAFLFSLKITTNLEPYKLNVVPFR